MELKDITVISNFSFRSKNKAWYTSITKFLDKLMYVNSLFNKSYSVCVCRSALLLNFVLDLVNLLGVFLKLFIKVPYACFSY